MPVTPEQAAAAIGAGLPFYYFAPDITSYTVRQLREATAMEKVEYDGNFGYWSVSDGATNIPLDHCHLTAADAWRAEAARIRALVPEVEAMAAEAERRADGAK